MITSENLHRLLANLEPLRRWAILSAHARAFNVFSILRGEGEEVGLHTAFIEALINPAGTHGCGATLLELFLVEIGVGLPHADLSGAIIERERRTSDSGQIDLLIELPRAGIVVIVENKIYAGDQHRQLERYHQLATKRAGPTGRAHVFYLTLHGTEPSAASRGTLPLEKVTCVSYREHILRWIARCIEKASRHATLRETLAQYEELIKKLTGQSMNDETRDEVLGLLAEGSNAELAQMIVTNWTHMKWRTTWAFWQEIEVALRQRLSDCTMLDVNKYTSNRLDGLYWRDRKKDYHFGLTLRIGSLPGSARDEVCLCLCNSDDGGSRAFFGLAVLREKDWKANQRDETYDSVAAQVAAVFHQNSRNDWWIGWRHFQSVPLDLVEYSNAETLALVNPAKRAEVITALCDELEACVTTCGIRAFLGVHTTPSRTDR